MRKGAEARRTKQKARICLLYTSKFFPGEKPWGKIEGVDVYMPCATQNEIKIEDAEAIVKQGVKYVVEVSNMPCTNDAIACMQKAGIVMAPSKAVNAGGVAVSALEMSQNSQRLSWTCLLYTSPVPSETMWIWTHTAYA